MITPWQWPSATAPVSLKSLLEPRQAADRKPLASLTDTGLRNLADAMDLIRKKWPGKNPATECFVVDLKNSQSFGVHVCYDKFGTITKSHAGDLWLTHLQDLARPSEVLAAQGIQRSMLPGDASDKHLFEMAGNAFCVPVVARILRAVLPAIGFKV